MTGILYGVGIGPGEPELMTIKAARIIQECDIIAIPKSGDGDRVAYNIAVQTVPELAQKEMMLLDMPMTRDKTVLKASHINASEQICKQLDQGKSVAFLTLGDPTIYSTYIYVHKIVKEKGYQPVIIPGVPSFCAVAAKLSDSLTEASEPLHIIPGSYDCMEACIDLPGTKVLMKTGKSLPKVREILKEHNLLSSTKMVQNCGMNNETIYENMNDTDNESGYFSILVVKENANGGKK